MQRVSLGAALAVALLFGLGVESGVAGGPRFVSGRPYFTNNPGTPIGWRQPRLLYFTDPGPLSASVTHAQADALVAAAASVWNLPLASVTISQGGLLAEDVSGENVSLGTNGVVFPADAGSSNAQAIPIAIVYDADGSVTDTLLGAGASNPLGCRQNAVTESVDAFDPAGYLEHAIVIVNGRCTGPAPEQQLQMQYQLERVFGRVLGLAWSQANDNVFTGTPAPTYQQAMHWPIMHPLDIYCGAYTYQCLPQPFTLRPDDIAAMVMLYPNHDGVALPPGKQPSLASAFSWSKPIAFPTGEGMAGVNVVVHLQPALLNVLQPWIEASVPTGYGFRRNASNPFVAADTSVSASFGNTDPNRLGDALFAWLPIVDGANLSGLVLSSEPVNPLYIGSYSIGPYASGTVAPSGSPWNSGGQAVYEDQGRIESAATIADAAAACGDGEDGTSAAPVPADASGWWTGTMCGYGHVAYVSVPVKPGRSLTVEVTALDEQGAASTTKMRPVIAAFAPSDAADALPSVAVAPEAFSSKNAGMTSLNAATGSLSALRLGIADQRNDGRPDFLYRARLFYGDTIAPALVPAAGARAVISGSGFRTGNAVLVNGVRAQVTGWTANTITLQLPTMAQANAASGVAVDVEIEDLGTGATSVLTSALTYSASPSLPASLRIVGAPAGVVYTGVAASTAFTVQETAADGVTPIAGQPIVFTMPPGAGSFGACGQATCTIATDSTGTASTALTPAVAGTLVLTGADGALPTIAVRTSVTVVASAGSMVVLSETGGKLYATQPAGTPFAVRVFSGGANPAPVAGRSVRFTVPAGAAVFNNCLCADMLMLTNSNGTASASITPEASGALTLQAADGPLVQQVSLTVASFADTMQLVASPSSFAVAGTNSGSFAVALVHGDGVTPDPGEWIQLAAPAGVSFRSCPRIPCAQMTDQNGHISTQVVAQQAGTYTVSATFGALTQTATFTVLSSDPVLRIVSAPSGSVPVGQPASIPVTAVLIDAFGNPMQGAPVGIDTAPNVAFFPASQNSTIVLFTDGNGQVSTSIQPIAAGEVPISVGFNQQLVTTSFLAVSGEKLVIVQQPGSVGVPVQVPRTFILQRIGLDGKTPLANEWIWFSVPLGSLDLQFCDGNHCAVLSDANGMVPITGTPEAAGPITLLATDGSLSQTIQFMAVQPPDRLSVGSAPAPGSVAGSAAAAPFSVKVLLPDGTTPAANHRVTVGVAAGSASLAGCGGASSCVLTADLQGTVTTAVTPLAAGTITLTAAEGGGSVSASFTAAPPKPDTLTLVSAPASSSPVGQANATPFAVRVLQGDGVSPSSGQAIVFAVTAGSASLSACASAPCTVLTDAGGFASTSVTPTAAGTIGISASETSVLGNIVSASFTAVTPVTPPPPVVQMLTLVTAPTPVVFAGTTGAAPFAIRLTLADGITPVAGTSITFTGTGNPGAAVFVLCGLPVCTAMTDATGLVSSSVTGVSAESLTLTATAPSPGGGVPAPSVSVTLRVVADQFSLTVLTASAYVAEGATVQLPVSLQAMENGSPAAKLAVDWAATGSLSLGQSQTITAADGTTLAAIAAGPLAAGEPASLSACAWVSVCAQWTATGVADAALRIGISSGGWQTVSRASGVSPAAITARVTDGAGHPVAGALVTAYQTVTAYDAACPAQGRCPAAAVLASGSVSLVSDANGIVTVDPLTVSRTPTQTEIALAAGTQGFCTSTLTLQP